MQKSAIIIIVFSIALLQQAHQSTTSTQATYQHIVTYVDQLLSQWGQYELAGSIDVPGYTQYNTPYNVVNLAFIVENGFADATAIWINPRQYMDPEDTYFGNTNSEIQQRWRSIFNQSNIKIVISAFGATYNPTSKDATSLCSRYADYVLQYNLDGIDLDYEDNQAMDQGIAEEWLINCTKAIRAKLPIGKYILTHAPQAPYFVGKSYYKNGGYVTIHEQVGDMIDWYNIQYYNQEDTSYDTYDLLFIDSGQGIFAGTAVKQIHENWNIPYDKLVVGKPVTAADADNTGYVPPDKLHDWGIQAQQDLGWNAGFMDWEYYSDIKNCNGNFMATVVGSSNIKAQNIEY